MFNTCLVTGGNGHLCNNLVRALLDKGKNVRASVRNVNYSEPFEGLDCEVVYADLLNRESLSKAMLYICLDRQSTKLLLIMVFLMKIWNCISVSIS